MAESVSWEFSDALAFDFDGYDLTVRDRCTNLQSYDHKKYEIKVTVTKRSEPVKVGDVITDKSVMKGLPRGTIVMDTDRDPWKKGLSLWVFGTEDPVEDGKLLSDLGPVTVLYLPDSKQ